MRHSCKSQDISYRGAHQEPFHTQAATIGRIIPPVTKGKHIPPATIGHSQINQTNSRGAVRHTNGPNNTRAKICRTPIFLMPNFCHAQDTVAKRSKALSASTLIINVPTVHSPTHSSFLFNCAIKAHRFAEGPSVSTDTGKACNTSQFHCFCFLLGHWYAMCPASPHL